MTMYASYLVQSWGKGLEGWDWKVSGNQTKHPLCDPCFPDAEAIKPNRYHRHQCLLAPGGVAVHGHRGSTGAGFGFETGSHMSQTVPGIAEYSREAFTF